MRRRTVLIWAGVLLTIAVAVVVNRRPWINTVRVLKGAVIAKNEAPHLRRPIGNATITVSTDTWTSKAVSQSSGLFEIQLNPSIDPGQIFKLTVEHRDFEPIVMALPASNQLYVLQLNPAIRRPEVPAGRPEIPITNIRVRYATRIPSTSTVGTAVRAFTIDNKGNIPCQGKRPCSPDGKWKATVNSVSLDTGDRDKQFRNVRLSCIAGPCPFSAIESDQFSRGGRTITASVRNWSDPVTWLVEAEVALTTESDFVRHTYPATFGSSMNFSLPAVASGLSIEAEVGGSEIVFPLGPELHLSWATCRFENGPDGTKQYRCELKEGYQFR